MTVSDLIAKLQALPGDIAHWPLPRTAAYVNSFTPPLHTEGMVTFEQHTGMSLAGTVSMLAAFEREDQLAIRRIVLECAKL